MQKEHYLIFDLETIPLPWESFSDSQQEYLLRGTQTDEDAEKKKKEMALSPLTAQIVCLGMQLMEPAEGEFKLIKRAAWAVDNNITDLQLQKSILKTGDECYLGSEQKLIRDFWGILKKYDPVHLISFNGRNFDAPFIMLRSALHNIRPYRNLMSGTKFNYNLHTDLIDELCFYNPSSYGATRRFNFDFYTRAFGITSPKSEGIDGSKVNDYFNEGRIEEISEYCLRDVVATWELYRIWLENLKF